MWVKSVQASLRSGRVKDELRLSVLLRDRIVVRHYDRSVWIPIRSHAQPEQTQINYKREDGRTENKQKQAEKYLSKPLPEFRRCERHRRRL
jgi:hypothetical protein